MSLRLNAGLCSLAVAVAFAARARAEPEASAGPTGLVLGLKLGGGIGAPLGESDASVAGEAELGFVLPPLDHAFELFAAFAYAMPGLEGSSETPDPRLPGDGLVRYRVQQQVGAPGLGLRFRLHLPGGLITPYAGAGGRLYLIQTDVDGSAGGEEFGLTRETGTAFGAFFALGAELALGPGALLLELQIADAGVGEFVLRDTSVGMTTAMIGYRLMLPAPRRGAVETAEAMPPPPPEPSRAPSGEEQPADAAVEPIEPVAPAEQAPTPAPATEPVPAADPVQPAPATAVPPPAEPAPAMAQVRGHVHDFSGKPLRSTIRIQPLGHKVETDAQGYFQIDVPPGRYRVRLRSFGYVSQTRHVAVEENGVTVLNVELGKK